MINFLVWYNPATWFDDVSDGLFGALFSGIRLLFNMISVMLYKVMITLYDIFDVLCSARLLDNEILDELSARVGLILGLIMLFYVIFSFIKLLLDPDSLTDKTKGAVGIVKRVLIVIVMLGVASFAFRTLFFLQTAIVHNHVISKLVLPYDTKTDNFGNVLAAELFTSFYRVDRGFYDNNTGELLTEWKNNSDVLTCEGVVFTLKDDIYDNGDFSLTNFCLNEVALVNNSHIGNQQRTIIDFNWLFMIGVGIAVDYFLISYCIAVGVRMIRLAVLEIISPMAFVSYLAPKQDTMFSKWLKVYFSTYLDVFIRIGIISFVAFLCVTIMDTSGGWEFWNTVNDQPDLKNYIIAFMIVALLTFAKKAPDLLKDLGFSGGAFGGFHLKDALGLTTAFKVTRNNAGRAIGIVGGGAINSAIGMIDRGIMAHRLGKGAGGVFGAVMSGAGAGWANAFKNGIKNKGQFWKNIPAGFKAQHESDVAYENLVASGGSTRGKYASAISSYFGETSGQQQNRMIANANRMADFRKQARDAADEMSFVKSAKDAWEHAVIGEHEDQADFEKRKDALYKTYTARRNAAIKHSLGDSSDLVSLGRSDGKDYVSDIASDSTNSYEFRHIQSIHAQARQYSESRHVQYYDSTGTLQTLGVGAESGAGAYDWLNNLGDMAKDNELFITSDPNMRHAYHEANDQAAGVSDKRKWGPPTNK